MIKNSDDIKYSKELFAELKNSFSNFHTIIHFLNQLEKYQNRRKELKKFLEIKLDSQNRIIENIFKNSEKILQHNQKIISISNSSTLIKLFEYHQDKSLSFYICESRPQFEGRIFASELTTMKFEVKLITEAQMAEHVKISDFAIISADQILADGSAVNKVGSQQLAIICKYFKKPFYVISDQTKKTRRKTYKKDIREKAEILPKKLKNIDAENYYFETIPKELITEIITD